ncbi:hypothetical protein QO207_14615 [Pseudomonas sp. CAN2814]|uniref:hypothetical protein n=1 Tax=Pseudomonas sp. CAN1 TaxID=3046726 RepID=UPI0026495624|nr:hypothetical protein [Pseudomonas sp. CAN1]MDN6857829.1 hypothetical protein [Pseudomonas sp. CAN1]
MITAELQSVRNRWAHSAFGKSWGAMVHPDGRIFEKNFVGYNPRPMGADGENAVAQWHKDGK